MVASDDHHGYQCACHLISGQASNRAIRVILHFRWLTASCYLVGPQYHLVEDWSNHLLAASFCLSPCEGAKTGRPGWYRSPCGRRCTRMLPCYSRAQRAGRSSRRRGSCERSHLYQLPARGRPSGGRPPLRSTAAAFRPRAAVHGHRGHRARRRLREIAR